jgi:two-component system, LuxR family, sensor histidine kinase TtrS
VLRLLFLPLLIGVLVFAAPTARGDTVRLALLAPDGRVDMLRSWDKLERHLRAALPEHRLTVQNVPHAALHDAIANKEVDFFVANSGFFVEVEATHGVSPLATLVSPYALSPREAISATVIASADRADLTGLADLRAKRVVAVHELAFGGYQLGLHALKEAGVPRDALKSLEFTGLPAERLLDAVASGRADAAILRTCVFERLAGNREGGVAAFKVLGATVNDDFGCARSSALYPDWPFAVLPHVDPALAKRVAVALLAMPRTSEGYAWTVPTDYSSVRRVFLDLQIGPYAHLEDASLWSVLHRYRYWAVIALLAILGGLLHILRAESLVRSRTQALRNALVERERMERESRERERQLDHLSRLGVLGEMSSMIAHELNQPLAAIGNFARGISRRVRAGRNEPDALVDASDQIAHQAERAAGILQRIRDFARNRPTQHTVVDLRTVFDESVALFRGLMPDAPAIEHEIAPECRGGALVFADPLQLSQVMINLLKNASDAMQHLPPERRRIRVNCRREAGQLQVEVADLGEGLKGLPVHCLFEPFSTTKAHGMGLGLAICKRVIEAHGGSISARANDPDPGLTVCFTLPRHTENAVG